MVGVAAAGLWWAAALIVQILRLIVSAVLILAEPVVRAVLVPVALLGFLVTLVFGFLIGDANFPRWGMLAFSVGALVLYWLYLGLMSLFMSLPSHDRHHR
ncbi:hypothetical protein DBA29_26640 [Xenophilus aerolatus]|nr:hypothetical protein [Xenophilus aerolatus]